MDEILERRFYQLLKHIDCVIDDTKGLSCEEFASSNLLVRATCFSIEQIGEQMKSLEKKIGKLYPGLPWSKSIGMRVMIAHVYHKVEPEVVYLTATRDIPLLKDQMLAIKNELDSTENN